LPYLFNYYVDIAGKPGIASPPPTTVAGSCRQCPSGKRGNAGSVGPPGSKNSWIIRESILTNFNEQFFFQDLLVHLDKWDSQEPLATAGKQATIAHPDQPVTLGLVVVLDRKDRLGPLEFLAVKVQQVKFLLNKNLSKIFTVPIFRTKRTHWDCWTAWAPRQRWSSRVSAYIHYYYY
jgi:hypothetical protein